MTTQGNYEALRRQYNYQTLSRKNLPVDPLEQFNLWMKEAVATAPGDATSMALATTNAQGQPSVRIVLLKYFDAQGLVWYTDSRSQKGQELAANPYAQLLFYWAELERQVRVSGTVKQFSAVESAQYFNKRPVDSRMSAAASQQSAVIDSREQLQAQLDELEQLYPQGNVPCPDYWRGYRLIPEYFEFWQGRENRFHDRFRFIKQQQNWQIDRLSP